MKGECFATSEQLFKKHQEIQEKTTNGLKNLLKGPNEFTEPLLTQLQQVIQQNILSYFVEFTYLFDDPLIMKMN